MNYRNIVSPLAKRQESNVGAETYSKKGLWPEKDSKYNYIRAEMWAVNRKQQNYFWATTRWGFWSCCKRLKVRLSNSSHLASDAAYSETADLVRLYFVEKSFTDTLRRLVWILGRKCDNREGNIHLSRNELPEWMWRWGLSPWCPP